MTRTTAATSASLRAAARARSRRRTILLHSFLLLAITLMLYPLVWLVVSSLRPNELIFSDPTLLPSGLTLDNYIQGWSAHAVSFAVYFGNSAFVTVAAILGNLLACSLAAYAFARLRFKLKTMWMAILLGTIMLPEHVTIVPQYVLFSELGWLNTFLPLVAPKFFAADAFFVFLIVQFIRTLPRELNEAAEIDGCGQFAIYRRIVLPLIVPALATTAIFTFIWTWNDFSRPLVFLTDARLYTVPMALRLFVDAQAGTNWGALFAMSVLSLIPVFLFFIFGQRFLIRGIATTGLK